MESSRTRHVKAALFDADGVTVTPKAPFSVQYAQEHGLDANVLATFFDDKFDQVILGERDVKTLLEERRDLWQWTGSIDDLVEQWHRAENDRNEELVKIINQARTGGIKSYLATNQDTYRTKFLKEQMFDGVFDGIFSSSQMGLKKPDPEYYRQIISTLSRNKVITQACDVVYFDDHPSNVKSAQAAGIRGYVYMDANQVRGILTVSI